MREIWFDFRRIVQLVKSSRVAWECQSGKCVARWSTLVCTWLKLVVTVSKVGRFCRTLSHPLRHPDASISQNVSQTRGFNGEQNHRERGIQYETGGSLARATHVTHHRAKRVAVKTDFFMNETRTMCSCELDCVPFYCSVSNVIRTEFLRLRHAMIKCDAL